MNEVEKAKILKAALNLFEKVFEKRIKKHLAENVNEEPIAVKGDKGDPGPKGEKGDPGPKGDKGDPGSMGLRGERGLSGEKGDPGKDGVDGKDGDPGPKGDKGEKGDPGKDGRDGVDGKDGEQGQKGEKGDPGKDGVDGKNGEQGQKGEKGDPGPKGDKGEKGDLGPKGDKGEKGEKGDPGKDGRDGIDGKDGERGERGEKGEQGERGEKGDRGEKGEKGDRGEKGEQGEPGPAGKDVDAKKLEEFENLYKEHEKLKKDFNNYRNLVNQQMSSIGGGGSVRILDNDDVVFQKRHEVEGNAILIFDKDINKFKSESFTDIIERLKVDLEVQYDKLIFETTANNVSYTYVGEATPGAVVSDPVWRIKRVAEYSDGLTEVLWANDSVDFDKIWDDRESYTYDS